MMPPAEVIAAARAAETRWPAAPAAIQIGQWALESGWGAHMPAGSLNPFGVKALPGQPCVVSTTTERIGGKDRELRCAFRKFSSLEEAFELHARLLALGTAMRAARACLKSKPPIGAEIEAYAYQLGGGTPADPRYATADRVKYGAALVSIMRGADLYPHGAA